MTVPRRGARMLMRGAGRLIPAAKADWMRAMESESECVAHDGAALAFAAGCVRAAATERIRTLAPAAEWCGPGAALALVVTLHAMIPGSAMRPLLWAPLAGIVAVLTLSTSGRSRSFSAVVAIAGKAGVLAGLLFGGALLLPALGGEALAPERLAACLVGAGAIACLTAVGGTAVAPLVCVPAARRRIPSSEEE